MSARAACRLEDLGFSAVFDYVAGKAAWLALGLPSQGAVAPDERVASIASRSLPEVAVGDRVGDLAPERFGDHDAAVVLDGDVVAGLLRRETLGLPRETPVRAVVQPAPDTFRPSMTISELRDYWRDTPERVALVTTLHGVYLGAILRDDLLPDAS